MAASARTRNFRELNIRQGLYSGWGGGGTFQGETFLGEDWWNFTSRDWKLYSVGQGLGSLVRTVRMFCEWNLVVRGPQGRGLRVTHYVKH